jgi:hypothetical protein
MRPSLTAHFSSSVLRCLGASMSEASTICPPIAIRPASRSAASKLYGKRLSAGGLDPTGRVGLG